MVTVHKFERYSVDENGNIYSNYFKSRTGKLIKRASAKLLSIAKDSDGYGVVTLYSDTEKKTCKVHRIVAESFLKNTNNNPQVNHKNGDKLDNRLSNLEWCTSSENQKHSYRYLKRYPTKYWEGKMNHDIRKPCIVLDCNMRPIGRWDSQKELVLSGLFSKSSVSKKINTGIKVKGLFIYEDLYLKAYHSDVWQEAYALSIGGI